MFLLMAGLWKLLLVMKQTTTAVINLINAARAASDSAIVFAECFTFITTTGATYTWTTVDYEVVFKGFSSMLPGRSFQDSSTKGRSASKSISSRSPLQRVPQTSSTARRFSVALRDGAFDGTPSIEIGSFSQGRWDLIRRSAAIPGTGIDSRQCRAHSSDRDGRVGSRDP